MTFRAQAKAVSSAGNERALWFTTTARTEAVRGAHPPRVQFRQAEVRPGLAENSGRTEIVQAFPAMSHATAERGARSATPGGGCAPRAPKRRARSVAPCLRSGTIVIYGARVCDVQQRTVFMWLQFISRTFWLAELLRLAEPLRVAVAPWARPAHSFCWTRFCAGRTIKSSNKPGRTGRRNKNVRCHAVTDYINPSAGPCWLCDSADLAALRLYGARCRLAYKPVPH